MMKMIENNCRPASTAYFTVASSARDGTDHLRMNRAVVRPDGSDLLGGAGRAGAEIPAVNRAVVQHDAMRRLVDVVPDDHLSRRERGRVRRERLRSVDRDDVDRHHAPAGRRGTRRVCVVAAARAAAPDTETERANREYCGTVLHDCPS